MPSVARRGAHAPRTNARPPMFQVYEHVFRIVPLQAFVWASFRFLPFVRGGREG
jgi:hypothetical protein